MDPLVLERSSGSNKERQSSLDTNSADACTFDRASFRSFSEPRLLAGILGSFGGVFLITFFFAVSCYFVVVTIVNPRGVFWGRSFPEIMPNSRGLKLDLLQKYNRAGPVQLVVLGSSRTTKLSPNLLESLTGERAFNAGVFSAAPNDYLAIYRAMKQRGIVPKTLVVGLDVEALDPANGPAPDFTSNLELNSALNGTIPDLTSKIWHWVWLYKKSLSPSYIQEIAKSIWVWLKPRPPLFEFQPNGQEEDRTFDLQMQSGVYPGAEKIKACEDSLQAKFENFPAASPELERDLRELLSEAASDKVRVVLWITPVHPGAIAKILQDPEAGRNFQYAHTRLLQLGAAFHLPVRNFTHSQSFGGHPDSWYDCAHYSQADADRITRELFKNGL